MNQKYRSDQHTGMQIARHDPPLDFHEKVNIGMDQCSHDQLIIDDPSFGISGFPSVIGPHVLLFDLVYDAFNS